MLDGPLTDEDRAAVQREIARSHVDEEEAWARVLESRAWARRDDAPRAPLTMIVAIARNGVIGKGDKTPWPISEDLRHFKRETMGHTLIVGRKTALSLPPLPGRSLIVLSRAAAAYGFTDGATTIEDAIARARETDPHPIVIGGAEVYRAALPFVTRILLTEIDHDYEGDVRFELDRTGFVETSRRAGETPGVSFVTLERKDTARSEQIMGALRALPLSEEPPTEGMARSGQTILMQIVADRGEAQAMLAVLRNHGAKVIALGRTRRCAFNSTGVRSMDARSCGPTESAGRPAGRTSSRPSPRPSRPARHVALA